MREWHGRVDVRALRLVEDLGDEPPCPACGCRQRVPLFVKHGQRYVACPRCGVGHADPLPSEAEIRAWFSDDYFRGGVPGGYDDYRADEDLHRRNARRRLASIEAALGRRGRGTGRLLDVGCAFGYLLDEARRRGWKVEGVEPSPGVAEHARFGGEVNVVPDLADVARESPGAFDVVTVCQVLAHVRRPDEVLALARRCLRDDGLLFLETWDRDSLLARASGRRWHMVVPPTVVWLPNRRALARLLERAGFRVVRRRRAVKEVRLRFVGALLADLGGPSARLARPLERWGRRALPYALGDIVWVAAEPV